MKTIELNIQSDIKLFEKERTAMNVVESAKTKVEYGVDSTVVTFNENRIADEEQIQKLKEEFELVIGNNHNEQMILNFSNVRLVTATLLDFLVTVYKRVCESGGRIRLSNLDSNLRRIFEITGLSKVFDIS